MSYDTDLTSAVLALAGPLHIPALAVTSAEPIDSADRFERWLAAGHHAGMDWLNRNRDKRFNPAALLDDAPARSVICLALSYAPARREPSPLAEYAHGRDYHNVLKQKAHALCDAIRRIAPAFVGRAFVDSAPLAERCLAARAGLGWIGRNGMLIVPGLGAEVVLAEIVCNLPLAPGEPIEPQCGPCRACQAACPTGALQSDGTIDCQLCLSYHSIENAGPVPDELAAHWGGRVFGCDACVHACPHAAGPAGDDQLQPRPPDLTDPAEVLDWSDADWDAFTQGRALRRASYIMWLRNAILAAASTGRDECFAQIATLAGIDPAIDRAIAQARHLLGR
jgi:epoxyqueuosine reductase